MDLISQTNIEYKETKKDKQTITNHVWNYAKHKRRNATVVTPLYTQCVLVPDVKGKGNTLNQQYFCIFSSGMKRETFHPKEPDAILPCRTSILVNQESPSC